MTTAKMEGQEKIIIAGFGGQGVMLAGKIIAQAACFLGRSATYLPSYGAEVRGGTAHCHVIVSEEEIPSPVIEQPDTAIAMNSPSLEKFKTRVRPGGNLLVNSSLVKAGHVRRDIKTIEVEANRLAEELGSVKAANMVMIGVCLRLSRLLTPAAMEEALKHLLPSRHRELLDINLRALRLGASLNFSDSD